MLIRISFLFSLYSGGFLDNFIQKWHSTFNLPNGDRDLLPNNNYLISFSNAEGEKFSFNKHFVMQKPSLGIKKTLWENNNASINLQGEVALPLGSSVISQQGVDLLLGLIYQLDLKNISSFISISSLYYSDNKLNIIKYKTLHSEAVGGIKLHITNNIISYLVINFLSNSINMNGVSTKSAYINLGLEYSLTQKGRLYISIKEDPYKQDLASDVVFLLGLSHNL